MRFSNNRLLYSILQRDRCLAFVQTHRPCDTVEKDCKGDDTDEHKEDGATTALNTITQRIVTRMRTTRIAARATPFRWRSSPGLYVIVIVVVVIGLFAPVVVELLCGRLEQYYAYRLHELSHFAGLIFQDATERRLQGLRFGGIHLHALQSQTRNHQKRNK